MEEKVITKKALLLYSKTHFDPSLNKETTTSVGIMSKSIYNALIKTGFQVDYLDSSEFEKSSGDYDLFIGHLSNWMEAAKKSNAKVTILFQPTSHPLNRNKKIKSYAKKWGAPEEELFAVNDDSIKSYNKADYIFQIGNEYAIKSLLENGVDLDRILHLHYGIDHLDSHHIPKKDTNSFLHLASGLGLRKGLPKVIDIFNRKEFADKNLSIVGSIYTTPNTAYWKNTLHTFIEKNPNVKYLGYIDSNTPEYRNVLDANSWLLFPTIEEGEPGTVIEAMSRGLIPIMEMDGGNINFNIGTPKDLSVDDQIKLVQQATPKDFEIVSEKAMRYVSLFHDHAMWENKLEQIFSRIAKGESKNLKYPKVSIVLSIYNKENSITELLLSLWANTKNYPDWDIHIIFDGCIDATKVVTMQTVASFTVPVYTYETPNIFETKSNNLGLKNAQGEYCVIVQDDNFITEKNWLQKMIDFMEERQRVAVLGGLAGVDFYPLDSVEPGLNKTFFEAHKRIDWRNDSSIFSIVQEVDAVMRGPIVLRKKLLEEFGYFDEAYAPFYDDDMDYCFRMKKLGFGVFYYPIMVENRNLTIQKYDTEKRKFWDGVMEKNSTLLYSRWSELMDHHETKLVLPKPDWHTKNKSGQKIKIYTNAFKGHMDINLKKIIKTMFKKILLKTPNTIVMFLVKNFYRVGNKINQIASTVFLHKFQKRTIPWHAIKGDETLRVTYTLHNDSVVFDVGGYTGQWAHEIAALYGCTIHIFEPVKKFADAIQNTYKNNSKMIIRNFGLSNQNEKVMMAVDENSSSHFKAGESTEQVELVDVMEYIHQNNINKIDLMKINIEGGEYDILEALLRDGFIKNIDNIQVQFHDFVPGAEDRMRAIQKELRKTHKLTYQYEFVWENWERITH